MIKERRESPHPQIKLGVVGQADVQHACAHLERARRRVVSHTRMPPTYEQPRRAHGERARICHAHAGE